MSPRSLLSIPFAFSKAYALVKYNLQFISNEIGKNTIHKDQTQTHIMFRMNGTLLSTEASQQIEDTK